MKQITFTLTVKSEDVVEEIKKVCSFVENNGFELQSVTSWKDLEGMGLLGSTVKGYEE